MPSNQIQEREAVEKYRFKLWWSGWAEVNFRTDGDGVFGYAPNFNFNDDKVKFDANDVSNANETYGSASGAVPKFLLAKQKVSMRIPFVL